MKNFDVELSPEIKIVIENRRKKFLFSIYMLFIILIISMTFKDIYYKNVANYTIEWVYLVFIYLSYVFFYKKGKYNQASYVLLLILGSVTILSLILNKFDDYIPVFIIPFSLSTFFLFSWKKGIVLNFLFFIVILFSIFVMQDNFQDSNFFNNQVAINNFIIILFIILLLAFFYEAARVEAYKLLLESNAKKDFLYRELQHRVKNNLNIVISMLSMQAQKEDTKVKEIISVSKNRIESIAMVHSMLHVSNNIEKVNVKKFIEKLSNTLRSAANQNVKIELNIKDQNLTFNEMVPIGLIINELITNSFKYAFSNTKDPKITIEFIISNKNAILTYHDNGIGYSKDKIDSMGLKLVALNIKQLKGTLEVINRDGLSYKIIYERGLYV